MSVESMILSSYELFLVKYACTLKWSNIFFACVVLKHHNKYKMILFLKI